MNSGVMLFRRTPWMEEFLTKVAALGRIPEPELGKVQDPGISACRHHCESCQDHHVSRVRDSIWGPLSVPSFCPLRGSPDNCWHQACSRLALSMLEMSSPTKARRRGCRLAALRGLMPCAGPEEGADSAQLQVRQRAAGPERDHVRAEAGLGGAPAARAPRQQAVLPQLLLARPAP